MTHKETMAALVEAGRVLDEADEIMDDARMAYDDGRGSKNAMYVAESSRGEQYQAYAHQAVNARPTIALAAEGMKALKEWRECERQMNNVPNDTNDYHNAYNAMGAAWRRLDALLERWEGKE